LGLGLFWAPRRHFYIKHDSGALLGRAKTMVLISFVWLWRGVDKL
jgi:hypothetical protein